MTGPGLSDVSQDDRQGRLKCPAVQDHAETVPGPESRTRSKTASVAFSGIALLLALSFFPLLFNRVEVYDDEGFWLVTIRQFLHHGSLYVHTFGGGYGPFYFSFTGVIYRIIGQNPSLFNGRMLVLVFTTLSSGLLAATIWHVTRSVAFSILGEVVTSAALILVAGNEPMSPGSIIVLVLSVLVYALAGYAVGQRTGLLVIVGAAVCALVLIKINIGIIAVAGLVVALVVGNLTYPKLIRGAVVGGAVLLPFVLMFQRLSGLGIATFAFLIAISMLGLCAVMSVDAIKIPIKSVIAVGVGFGGVLVASLLWPLSSGTSLGTILNAVFVYPIRQVNLLAVLPVVNIQWTMIVITALVVIAVTTHRVGVNQLVSPESPIRSLALSIAALAVLGLGIGSTIAGRFGLWLPSIVLLPALAVIAEAPPRVRLALRLTMPIAILQVLHAYPVAGSQTGWATFLMFVPCSIALAAGMDGLRMWKEAAPRIT